jgi:hypothetical protein
MENFGRLTIQTSDDGEIVKSRKVGKITATGFPFKYNTTVTTINYKGNKQQITLDSSMVDALIRDHAKRFPNAVVWNEVKNIRGAK